MSDEVDTGDRSDSTFDVHIFGVLIGTASSYDECDDCGIQYYDFEPNEHFKYLFEKEPDTFSIAMLEDAIVYYPKGDAQNGPGISIEMKKFLTSLAERA